jgi:hypothetical protein
MKLWLASTFPWWFFANLTTIFTKRTFYDVLDMTPIVWERGVGGCQPGRCDMGDRSTRWSLVHPAINAPDVSLTTYYYLIPWLCEDRTVSDNVRALCLSSPCNSWQTHIDYCWQSQCSITPHSEQQTNTSQQQKPAAVEQNKVSVTNLTMPRLSAIENERSKTHLSIWRTYRNIILSPSHSLSNIHSFNALNDGSGWEMCDDDRIDRFSDNYYRFYWGLHKGGLVFAVFLVMILVTSLMVALTFTAGG